MNQLAPPLSFHVSDENGKSITGAKVALNDRLLQLTDKNGFCSFAEIADGEHDLEISARGYQRIENARIAHRSASTKPATHDYRMNFMPVTLAVGVMDRGGIVLEDVEISLDKVNTKTDKTGVVRLKDVYLNKGVKLTVKKKGFTTSTQKIILSPQNWSTEVYQKIILYRKKQFHVNASFQVNDDKKYPANNGDGKANSGESINLPVTVDNVSDEVTDSWTLAFRCDSPHLQFTKKPVYENKPLKPNETRRFLVPVKIRPTVRESEVLKLTATIIPANDYLGKEQKKFMLPVYPGLPLDLKLVMEPIVTDDIRGRLSQRNNGNNLLGPGEQGTIRLTIGNQGSTVKDVNFYLETLPDNLIRPAAIQLQGKIRDGVEIKSNQMVDPVFTIDIPRGYDHSTIPFIVMAESHGRVWGERFTVACEGKSDFHATMTGRGRLLRGSLCNYMLNVTYSGGESFLGNVMLLSDKGQVKMEPQYFRGRKIVYGKTMKLSGIMTVPPNYPGKTFKVTLFVQNMELGNAPVFKKDFLFKLDR